MRNTNVNLYKIAYTGKQSERSVANFNNLLIFLFFSMLSRFVVVLKFSISFLQLSVKTVINKKKNIYS